ncbi:DsbA family protein [Bailinhaonella thermotolerans]|uniref:Disulfide bond formation protein DsbA n=1 Tax=Bailinhaonella thermotolerans TaxID=1070861 RepID=A0A3A4A9M7_9ACTN|nr:DsbA family protein [Bailinhaonella thermotolerans]RJL22750.1 disulfide bond formation protein DsbA [Bailinhaonella thermotolerans]
MADRTPVDFWFDPFCPWAWLTSRWLIEVAAVRDIEPRWHVMSLYFLNKDRDIPGWYRELVNQSIGPVRVVAAAEAAHGPQVLGRLYTEMGERFHVQGRRKDGGPIEPIVAEALEAAGLDAGLVAAMGDEGYDEAVRRSHDDAMSRVGEDVGTPVISVNGASFFGPVVTPAPKGEAAGRLWDGVVLVAGTDGFFELKRTRDRDPIFD